ncbi:MAG: nucleoside hydrolase [Candidatus Heimdallarchaeota archaeon]|nr:MAG: nucleoside hydrolase [Candidatus Heimdallarchaeota archaeon]
MVRIYIFLLILVFPCITAFKPSVADTLQIPTPIIIDVDVDTSDTNALLYLLNSPSVTIRAITVSCGITYIDAGVENVLRLLDYLSIEDVLVAGGRSVPLETNHSFPIQWRQASTSFFGLSLPATDLQPSDMNASELIVSLLNESPMSIIALGPLTNIADALLIDPTISQKIERIDIMGGAVNVPGNIGNVYPQIPNYVAEWNFYIDPHAADLVFTSSIQNIRLIPLDATDQVPITSDFKSKLQENLLTKEAEIANQLLIEGLYFWDELTVVAFTNPEVVTCEMYHIDIIMDQEDHEGQSVRNVSAPVNAQVAVGADSTKFEQLFLKAINHVTTTLDTSEFSTTVTSVVTTSTTGSTSVHTSTTGSKTNGYSIYLSILILSFIFVYRKKES